jgi:hypothetical protein
MQDWQIDSTRDNMFIQQETTCFNASNQVFVGAPETFKARRVVALHVLNMLSASSGFHDMAHFTKINNQIFQDVLHA